jgi:hypothetical protein
MRQWTKQKLQVLKTGTWCFSSGNQSNSVHKKVWGSTPWKNRNYMLLVISNWHILCMYTLKIK